MFGFFKKKVNLSNLSKLTTKDIKILTKSMDAKECGEILRKAAHQGSLDCQIFFSTACIVTMQNYEAHSYPPKLEQDFIKYTKMAAEQGDVGSQFNLGKHYVGKVDLSDGYLHEEHHAYLKEAEHWYKEAANQGDKNSIEAIEELDSLFRMVD
ncbi:TPA: sel1 repeat family protein [Vibrio parahaemolyticus]|nr:sel1 repeat family protein [Vibrio parahaemolyticus]